MGGCEGGWVDFTPIISPLYSPTFMTKTSKISTQVEMQVGSECGKSCNSGNMAYENFVENHHVWKITQSRKKDLNINQICGFRRPQNHLIHCNLS